MATQAEGPVGTPSAQVVGNAFVEQYYHILHQSPELVHRFYQDSSVLSRPDVNGVMTSVTTMQGISDKILSLNYKDYKGEIMTADAQQSYGEGVIVLVTGCLTGRDKVKRKFVQSFFLAPQEKGFFVLNDVFRFVEESAAVETAGNSTNESTPADVLPPDSEQPAPAPDYTSMGRDIQYQEDMNDGAEVCDPSDNDESVVEDEVVMDATTNSSQAEIITVNSVSTAAEGDAPKKSYASIVKVAKSHSVPTTVQAPVSNVKVEPPASDRQSGAPAKSAPPVEVSTPSGESAIESSNVPEEVEGYSIYVRNLPSNATSPQLEEIFRKFGPIKQGGVQVRSNKQGFCFGFVEFESSSSMKSAIEASPLSIGHRNAVVEEKRTTTRVSSVSTNGGRARYPSGGRGGFRNESFRGRGNFGGGRGYGRSQGEFSGRPRSARSGETYQRVDQNGAGRGSRQAGAKQ